MKNENKSLEDDVSRLSLANSSDGSATNENNSEPKLGKTMPDDKTEDVSKNAKTYQNTTSIKVQPDWLPYNYDEYVNERLLDVNFVPDVFQKQAFYFLSRSSSIFVSAHTSSGKTLVAEYCVHLSQLHSSRTIYTSPIKALSNQKFYDFKQKFSDVGIITGDVQVNPNAQCLIMTTEILRNLVYRNSDLIRDTEFVIFDEVHYINDKDRGVVWEECIIMLPKLITLVLLSATIPNSKEFGDWVSKTKNKPVYVIGTEKRAVPLEHVIYSDWEVYSIDDKPILNATNRNRRTNHPTSNFKAELKPYSKRKKITGRYKIIDIANFVVNRKLTPSIFFCFSKRKCEQHGETLKTLNLTTESEKLEVKKFLHAALEALSSGDRYLPQVVNMESMVLNGVAVHHGSLLPLVKESIELLFSMNLIKLLVATETFAMGVNMPAKCCVFLSLSKIHNGQFRLLTCGEYTQMSGRAGRRGMDKIGTVIIADPKTPSLGDIKKVIQGQPLSLNSQFKLSFGLILLAVRSNVRVEEIMRSSYREHGRLKNYGDDMRKLDRLEEERALEYARFYELSRRMSISTDKTLRLTEDSRISTDNANKVLQREDVPLQTSAKLEIRQEVLPLRIAQYLESVRYICRENWVLIKKSSILKPGTQIMLKNNCVAKVWKIDRDNIFLECSTTNSSPIYPDMLLYPHSHHIKNDVKITKFAGVFSVYPFHCQYNLTDINSAIVTSKLMNAYELLCATEITMEEYESALRIIKYEEGIKCIKEKYSISSLGLIDEYGDRIKFLVENGYLKYHQNEENNESPCEKDNHGFMLDSLNSLQITLKGRVAAEIRTVNEVLVTELIFNNELEVFSGSQIISLFSAMICEEEYEEYDLSDELENGRSLMTSYYNRLSDSLGAIPPFEPLNFSLAQAVYEWCNGSSLGTLVTKFNILEGGFVRLILRLDECSREIANVSNIIGNTALASKFEDASIAMKRDIVFMPSLYL